MFWRPELSTQVALDAELSQLESMLTELEGDDKGSSPLSVDGDCVRINL